jgi:hypothetical protein
VEQVKTWWDSYNYLGSPSCEHCVIKINCHFKFLIDTSGIMQNLNCNEMDDPK